MREIKFRYTYSDGKSLFHKFFTLDEIEQGLPFDVLCDSPLLQSYKCIAKSQYTGLQDKNGVEIYDGDVVKYNDAGGETHTQVIEYNDEMGAFCCDRGAYVDYFTCMWEIEVIGNVYENPKLLKDNL